MAVAIGPLPFCHTARALDFPGFAADAVMNGGAGTFIVREPGYQSALRNHRCGEESFDLTWNKRTIPNEDGSDRAFVKAEKIPAP